MACPFLLCSASRGFELGLFKFNYPSNDNYSIATEYAGKFPCLCVLSSCPDLLVVYFLGFIHGPWIMFGNSFPNVFINRCDSGLSLGFFPVLHRDTYFSISPGCFLLMYFLQNFFCRKQWLSGCRIQGRWLLLQQICCSSCSLLKLSHCILLWNMQVGVQQAEGSLTLSLCLLKSGNEQKS